MLSPTTEQLSVFMTPWMNPTDIQLDTSAACRCATAPSSARLGDSAASTSGRYRSNTWPSSARKASSSPRAAKYSNVPTRTWERATRVRTAPGSTVWR